jgi:DNA processing protein
LEIKDPPPVLFFIGDLSLLKTNILTIIGTRKPNDNGKIIAKRIGKYFTLKGWAICNGLADGIDTFSILEQEKFCFAKVIGIVGSGLTHSAFRSLPKQSAANIEHILTNGGLVMSEMPPLKKQDTFSVKKTGYFFSGQVLPNSSRNWNGSDSYSKPFRWRLEIHDKSSC